MTVSISDCQHKQPSALQFSAIMLSIVMLRVIMLRVIMLSVIMLSVVMLSIVAPLKNVVKNKHSSLFGAASVLMKKSFIRLSPGETGFPLE